MGPRETVSELAVSSGKENHAFYWVTKKIGYKPGRAGSLRKQPTKTEQSQVIEFSLFEPLDPVEPEASPAPGYFSYMCQ